MVILSYFAQKNAQANNTRKKLSFYLQFRKIKLSKLKYAGLIIAVMKF